MNPIFPALNPEEQTLYACLALQHKVGYAGFTRLMEVLRSPAAVYAASAEQLKTIHPRMTDETVESIQKGPNRTSWEKIAEQCDKLRVKIDAPGSHDYPAPLLQLNAPPPLLFIQGSWQPQDAIAVAIVGTRQPTDYGRKAAFTLANDLSRARVTVVSGFAVGIDAEAHAGTLDANGRTLAVIGCGADIPYPLENQHLRERIVQNGAIISEFPPGASPRRDHFPRRNRILSGLAKAIVVVEAGKRSGALLTAAHARTQGKTLFAMPGSVFSSASSGTHTLLKRDAKLAVSAEDILPALEDKPAPAQPERITSSSTTLSTTPTVGLSIAGNEPVLELWRDEKICGLDRLIARSLELNLWPAGNTLANLMQSLLRLQLRGLLQRLPGPTLRKNISRLPFQA